MRLRDAKKLEYGDMLEHKTLKGADGTPMQFRVTGAVKRWKRQPDRIRVPLKRGLYEYGELTNGSWEGSSGFSLDITEVTRIT